MASEWATVAAAAIGAFAGIGGGVALEMYKRRRDRIGTATTLAAAIDASVREVEIAGLVAILEAFVKQCDLDPNGRFDGKTFQDAPVKPNMFVFEKYIEKLGLLDSDLSARVILWFSTYAGLQHILWRSLRNVERNDRAAASVRTALKAWAVAAKDAPNLITDLRK
jgi:hypothetical protein